MLLQAAMYNLLRRLASVMFTTLRVTSYILLLSVSAATTMFNQGEALMSSSNGSYCCSGIGDDDENDYDDADLYIIGAVCLCVCLSQKSLFRTQRIWSFPCFLTLSVFKRFGRFHVF